MITSGIDFTDSNFINIDNVSLNNVDYTNIDFSTVDFENVDLGSGSHAQGCVEHYEEEINDLKTDIEVRKTNIKQKKSQFTNSAIDVGIACTDNLTGCNPTCNSTDGDCNISCKENKAACENYKTEVCVGENCTGINKTCADAVDGVCTVDCDLFPETCRISDLTTAVRVNLCDDTNYCDQNAARRYRICDNVGNCTAPINNTEIETDWYDPLSPGLSNVEFIRNENDLGGTETIISGGGSSSDKLAADSRINIRISASDPNYGDYLTDSTKYDSHGCGNEEFYLDETDPNNAFCNQKNVVCAEDSSKRGVKSQQSGGVCSADCPADIIDPNNLQGGVSNYLLQDGVCIPQCDHRTLKGCFPFYIKPENDSTCTDTVWLPLTTVVPIGTTFVQTSDCGKTRNAVGTSTAFARFDEAAFNLDYTH